MAISPSEWEGERVSKLHYDSNDRDDMTFKNCPFCGGEAFLASYVPSFTNDHYYFVVCEDCGARSKPTAKTMTEAIKDWNRRKPHER